ncbi:uncharacterized protein LOC131247875 isoform X2 [Magnolia sinica]|uniref:uncharacterized protein LOC131247875 isoform X2 n=1 Tax=Magnolia sinica TaxID=86752 RepID=UPI002658D605|nr:uncharacterized protein LOC131247875 isoform X2 [Magnolia sinica]
MGSGSSKDAAALPSSSDGVREARFKGARVFHSSCLGGSSDSSDDEDQVSGLQYKEGGRLKNEICTDQTGIKSDTKPECCGKVQITRSNQAQSISSDAELDGCSQERDAHIDSGAGSSSSQKVVSRSSSRLSRSLSRFNFIPDNISFRLSRAASLGSSCSYSFFSTSIPASNSEEGFHTHSGSDSSDSIDGIRAHSSHVELPCTNLSPVSQYHDPSSVAQQVDPPISVHSHIENIVPSQDVARNNTSGRPDSAVNGYFQRNHADIESTETRRFDRRIGAQEPVEGSVRFSRTLSVGRLRDRVLRRTSFPEGLFRHLQEDRVVGDTIQGNVRRFLGGRTRIESPDGNADMLPSSSSQNFSSASSSMNGRQDYELESLQLREARNQAFVERRTAFLERRRRIRSQVLDEIHQQSVVLSSRPSVSSIGSVPAPKEVVESMPVKIYAKPHKHQNEEVAQCYICLVEYDEGDCMRVLPCHHDFHRTCIDKWLKEIHRVCPLCRGDVCRSDSSPPVKVD